MTHICCIKETTSLLLLKYVYVYIFPEIEITTLAETGNLERFRTLGGRSRKHRPSRFEKCMSQLQRSHIHLIM